MKNSQHLLGWSLLLWIFVFLEFSSIRNKKAAAAETQGTEYREDEANHGEKDDETEEKEDDEVDYLIIGGGGSGIQMALYLQKYGYSYTILEKENVPGSFWNNFPRFRELISVNKWTSNQKHALRYDWHSFLEAPLTMFNITEAYWPTGDDWQTYMEQVVQMANVNIEYGAEVDHVVTCDNGNDENKSHNGVTCTKEQKPCVVMTNGTKRCAKRRIFVGTGLVEKKEPLLEAVGAIPYSQITREMARRKRVCIFGNGNAGFETAQNLYEVADQVSVYGKTPVRIAAVTKSTGDVRTKFLQVLENFHFKLRDTVDQADSWYSAGGINIYGDRCDDEKEEQNEGKGIPVEDEETEIPDDDDGIDYGEDQTDEDFVDLRCQLDKAGRLEADHTTDSLYIISRDECDVTVIATGFTSHVPGQKLTSRFPSTNDWYESTNSPRVHYIGWLMHERDFRRSSGGFLAGYRYLIRNLVHHVREQDDGIPYPRLTLTKEQIAQHVLHRLDVTTDLIILQDGVVLRDAIVPSKEHEGHYHYYEGVNYHYHPDIMEGKDVIFLYFAWGDTRRAQDVFENLNRYSDSRHLRNLHIHPTFELNGMIYELNEDLRIEWSGREEDEELIEALMDSAIDGDMTHWERKPTYVATQYERTVLDEHKDGKKEEKEKLNPEEDDYNPDDEYEEDEEEDDSPYPNDAVVNTIFRSILSNYSHEDLQQLTDAFQQHYKNAVAPESS